MQVFTHTYLIICSSVLFTARSPVFAAMFEHSMEESLKVVTHHLSTHSLPNNLLSTPLRIVWKSVIWTQMFFRRCLLISTQGKPPISTRWRMPCCQLLIRSVAVEQCTVIMMGQMHTMYSLYAVVVYRLIPCSHVSTVGVQYLGNIAIKVLLDLHC